MSRAAASAGALVRFSTLYRTKNPRKRQRDVEIVTQAVSALRSHGQIAALDIVIGLHPSIYPKGRKPRSTEHPPDSRPHVTVQPIGNDGRALDFSVHVYEDGTSTYAPRIQIEAPEIAGLLEAPAEQRQQRRKKSKSSGCVIL